MAKILIVDDRPTNRQFLLTLLGYTEHRLFEAANGADALNLAAIERPDLVISDILMPTMDGYEFVQRMRADPELAGTPVIFHTATYSAPQAKALADSCGVNIVLPKPCEPEAMLAAVVQALGDSAPAPQASADSAKPAQAAPAMAGTELGKYLDDLETVKHDFEEIRGHRPELFSDQDWIREMSGRFSENVTKMQRVASRLSALMEVGMEMISERDPRRLVELFFAAACDIVDSRYAAIGLLDEQEQSLKYVYAHGVDVRLFGAGDNGAGGLLAKLLAGHQSIRAYNSEQPSAEGLPAGHPPVRSFLGVPVASADRTYGWIYFADKPGLEGFDEQDERLTAIMAARLALLYENATLYDVIQSHAARLQVEVGERRRAEQVLAESEAGLHRAQIMSKLTHVITGPNGEFERWPDTLPQMIGMESRAMPKTTREWLEIVHPDDRALFRGKAIEAGSLGARAEFEYRLQRRDGVWLNVKQVMEPLQDQGRQRDRGRWFNTIQDITEQKRAEGELRESERRFSDMLRNVELISLMLDTRARVTYCNDFLLRITGWQPDEVLGKDYFRIFIPPEATKEMQGIYSELLANLPNAWHYENEILTRSGERRVVRWNNSLLRAGSGEIIGTASIGEDITDRRRAERESALHVQRLEVLHGMNAAILEARSPPEIAKAGLQSLRRAVPFWGATTMKFDMASSRATVLALEREPGAAYDPGTSLSLDEYGLADLAILKQGIICSVPDVAAQSARPAVLETLHAQGMRSYVRIPLLVEGTLVGALNLVADKAAFFTQEHVNFARSLADQLAIGLQQALLRDGIGRLNRIYAVLSGINSLIVRVRDREELCREACRIAVDAGHFPKAWIGLLGQGTSQLQMVASDGVDQGYFEKVRAALAGDRRESFAPFARALRHQKPLIFNDLERTPEILSDDAFRAGSRSMVWLPLVVSGQTAGVLTLHAEVPGFFDDEEMKLLLELAGDIAFALEHIDKSDKLAYMAYYDSLTGLANRTLLHERLDQYLRDAALVQERLALVLMDVERFKTINDTYGRHAGDALLRQLAERLAVGLQNRNEIARIGADHFAIIIPHVKSEDEVARSIEERGGRCFGEPFPVNGTELRCSAKAGIAMFPGDGVDADTLFKNAEAALKKAKTDGERYLFYTQEMTARVAERLSLENNLRRAIGGEEFVLHYQPKVDLDTRRITGVEALIRWNDSKTGLVPPFQFISLLEETGLILEVGAWALGRAAQDHRHWVELGLEAPRIAVNVSPIQLRQRDFVRVVQEAVKAGVSPTGIDLEITESLIMEDVAGNIEKLDAIRDMGMSIAIDDFGTGYSSLGYLAKLPVQTIKIDRSFIITMLEDPDTMTLVSTILSLAHSLRLKVVAEGVDQEEQAKVLRLLRCDQMQGYLFSKPLPRDDLTALLRAQEEG